MVSANNSINYIFSTLSEKMCKICTFRGTLACHWGSTLKGTPVVPFHMGTYLYPSQYVPFKGKYVPLLTKLYLIVLWYHNVPLKKVHICPFEGYCPSDKPFVPFDANLYSIQHIKKARMLFITLLNIKTITFSHFHRINI